MPTPPSVSGPPAPGEPGAGSIPPKGEPRDVNPGRRQRNTREFVILCVIGLSVTALAVHLLLPKRPGGREISPQLVCAANMKHIVLSMKLYASENGSLPDDPLRALLDSGETTTKLYICFSSGKTVRDVEKDLYVCFVPVAYDAPWWVEGTVASNAIVLYERDNHAGQGGNVVYADGHAEFIRPYSEMLRRVEESKRRSATSQPAADGSGRESN